VRDFNDQRGIGNGLLIACVSLFTGHHYVRVKDAYISKLYLHVFGKNLATRTVQVVIDSTRKVQDHSVVARRAAHHGENFAAIELVALGLSAFPNHELSKGHFVDWQSMVYFLLRSAL